MILRLYRTTLIVSRVALKHLVLFLDAVVEALDPSPVPVAAPKKQRPIRMTEEILLQCAEAGHEALMGLASAKRHPLPAWSDMTPAYRALLARQARSLFMHLPPLPESGWDEEQQDRFAKAAVKVADRIKAEVNARENQSRQQENHSPDA